jgi:hypothetical protein
LVLGNYPETDVILPITCCDACASVLLEMGQLQNGQRVTSALPLVSLKYERNRKLWEEKLSEVYGHRFHHSVVLLVFLSTLCTTIEDLIDGAIPPGCQNLRSSLEWCCKEVIKLPGITTVAGILPSRSLLTGAANDAMPLQRAIRLAFSRLQSTTERKALLAYPLDGFLALVRLAGLMKEFGPADIERFVWMRFLYYLSERHVGQQKQASIEKTQDLLECLIYDMSSSTVIADSSNETVSTEVYTEKHTISPLDLDGTYLFPEPSEILEQFQRTGKHFSTIQNAKAYQISLAVFLHILFAVGASSTRAVSAEDLFIMLQYRSEELRRADASLQDIFTNAPLVDETIAAKLIAAARASD